MNHVAGGDQDHPRPVVRRAAQDLVAAEREALVLRVEDRQVRPHRPQVEGARERAMASTIA